MFLARLTVAAAATACDGPTAEIGGRTRVSVERALVHALLDGLRGSRDDREGIGRRACGAFFFARRHRLVGERQFTPGPATEPLC